MQRLALVLVGDHAGDQRGYQDDQGEALHPGEVDESRLREPMDLFGPPAGGVFRLPRRELAREHRQQGQAVDHPSQVVTPPTGRRDQLVSQDRSQSQDHDPRHPSVENRLSDDCPRSGSHPNWPAVRRARRIVFRRPIRSANPPLSFAHPDEEASHPHEREVSKPGERLGDAVGPGTFRGQKRGQEPFLNHDRSSDTKNGS